MASLNVQFVVFTVLCLSFLNQSQSRRRRRRSCSPLHCQVSSWSSWSRCSAVQCGVYGSRQRSRRVLRHPSCGGAACPAKMQETSGCYGSAAVNCRVSSWSSWSTCSAVQCGKSGSQQRSRTVITYPNCGGTACPSMQDTGECFGTTAVDCVYSTWSNWSACPPSQCGDSQTSRRYIITREQCGGTPCNMTALRKTRPCKQTFCVNQGTLYNGECSCKPGYLMGAVVSTLVSGKI